MAADPLGGNRVLVSAVILDPGLSLWAYVGSACNFMLCHIHVSP